MIDDHTLFAWIDGELDDAAAAEVAAAVKASPELRARADRHRTLGATMRDAFAPVLDAPPPPRFGAVVDLATHRATRDLRRGSFGVPQWAAMAATLALGIVAGQFVGQGTDGPVEQRDGQMIAAASLDRALDVQLASAPGEGSARVGLTFRHRDGSICRSFRDGGASGVACRVGDDWRIDGLFAAPGGERGDYRMAAGEDRRLAALIDGAITGEPFDAANETAARDAGWR